MSVFGGLGSGWDLVSLCFPLLFYVRAGWFPLDLVNFLDGVNRSDLGFFDDNVVEWI